MKTIRLAFLLTVFSLLGYSAMAQTNNVYIITEKIQLFTAQTVSICDSVFVTDPTGVTTAYSLPSLRSSTKSHDAMFNKILNSVTSKGYKIVESGNWPGIKLLVNSDATYNPIGYVRTMFLAQP